MTTLNREILLAMYIKIAYVKTIITINEIRLNIFESILMKLSIETSLSLYLVARNNPAIIPARENTLLRSPFLMPSKAGIKTRIAIIVSRVFKIRS